MATEVMCSLDKLGELVKRVPSYNPWFFDESRTFNLQCDTGKAVSVGIYKDRNISVAKTTFEPNSKLKVHCHSQKEIIHVLEGEILLHFSETDPVSKRRVKRKVVGRQYDSIEIPPQIHHYCTNQVKTTIVAITMPYSPNFPPPDAQFHHA